MHASLLASIRRALSLTTVLCCLGVAAAASSRTGDTSSESIYLEVGAPEGIGRICGLYLFPGSLIAGTELHIFPDGTAMIAEVSDVALPRVIATGSWNYQAGILKITWSHLHHREILKSSMLPKRQGDAHEYVMYSEISSDHKAREYFLVPSGTRPTEGPNLIRQFVVYHDWQKIKSTYFKQAEKVNQTSEPTSQP